MIDATEEVRETTAIVSVVVGVFGLLGNAACARMMLSGSMQKYSTSYFILGCVLSDTVVLLFECVEDVAILTPGVASGYILYGNNSWRCRVAVFTYEAARLISSWLVVGMCVEVCIVSIFCDRRDHIYNTTRAKYVTLLVCLIAFAACFLYLVITISTDNNTCTSKYVVFYDIYTDVILQIICDSVVPILFILVCNVIFFISRRSKVSHSVAGPYEEKSRSNQSKRLQFKHFIIAVSLFFVACCLPDVVVQSLHILERHHLVNMPSRLNYFSSSDMHIAYYITKLLLTFNYGSKIYGAFLFEEEFRQALGKLFRCGRMTSAPSANLSLTNANMDHSNYIQSLRRRNQNEARL